MIKNQECRNIRACTKHKTKYSLNFIIQINAVRNEINSEKENIYLIYHPLVIVL